MLCMPAAHLHQEELVCLQPALRLSSGLVMDVQTACAYTPRSINSFNVIVVGANLQGQHNTPRKHHIAWPMRLPALAPTFITTLSVALFIPVSVCMSKSRNVPSWGGRHWRRLQLPG